ncbi:MAG: transcription antitermination factor NusB [Acidobacteriota bacterium]
MGERRKAREIALQILFQIDLADGKVEEILEDYWKDHRTSISTREFSEDLVKGTIANLEIVDGLIAEVSEHWKLKRMAVVDRNIIRMSIYEFLKHRDVPKPAVMNEAIEIAKKYSSDDAAKFINGILDAVNKKIDEKEKLGERPDGKN